MAAVVILPAVSVKVLVTGNAYPDLIAKFFSPVALDFTCRLFPVLLLQPANENESAAISTHSKKPVRKFARQVLRLLGICLLWGFSRAAQIRSAVSHTRTRFLREARTIVNGSTGDSLS
jgi:hypothetical protein